MEISNKDIEGKDILIDRVWINPQRMGGKPCILGTRIPVELIIEHLASGRTSQEIIDSYPSLSIEDIQSALRYALALLKNEELLTA